MRKFWSKYKGEYRKLLELGSPILVTQLSVIVLAFSDTIMVGHYNVDSLAASAFVNSLYLIPNVMLMGLAGGVTPLAGSLYSQQKEEAAGGLTRLAMRVNLRMSLLFTAIMGAFISFSKTSGRLPN